MDLLEEILGDGSGLCLLDACCKLRFDATREDFFGFYGFESESVVKLQLLCRSVEFMSFFFLIVSVSESLDLRL